MRIVLALLACLLLPLSAHAQMTTLAVKDGNGTAKNIGEGVDNAGTLYPVHIIGNLSGGTMATAPVSNTLGLSVNVTNGGWVGQGNATLGQLGTLMLGAVTTSAPSYSPGVSSSFSLDPAGNLRSAITTSALPIGAATSANQTNGLQKTQVVDGSGNVIASTSNNLNVQCANCSGSGVSAADMASYTAGASVFAASGGFFQTTATNNALTNLQQGMVQMTAQRAQFINVRDSSGNELGIAARPLQVSLANTAANGTAVTISGTITATQATGSNLHTAVDPEQRTLVALDVSTVTTGGTAVTALNAGHRTAGGFIQNPPTATINLCINEIGTAAGTTSSGSTTCIQPGQTYALVPASGAVSVIASDSSHAFSGEGLQ
jgi:hypothetical protein